ncbi:DUF1361 domain-containing protein [Candidatus Saccharibacteria bacterium]|nr:DUF1361 domain-containing protein [Candidatus Saccharibacteria bacterium]
MLKNICLAWLPVAITALSLVVALFFSIYWILSVVIIIGLCLWLLVFPNAPYLITELNFSHRKEEEPVPLYYDIIQTLALTLSGILVAQLSLVFVHALLILLLTPGYSTTGKLIIPDSSWLLMIICILLASFAVYIGRNVRLNSWDVIHPIQLFRRLFEQLRKEPRTALGYVALYSTFMLLFHGILFGGFIHLLLDGQTNLAYMS